MENRVIQHGLMRVAIIGRTEILFETAILLKKVGFNISCILTAKEAVEYTRSVEDFRELAEKWNIPFAQGPHIVDHFEFLKASKSKIAVSINYPRVVPQEVIDLFSLGILNAHGGDLPRYRGNASQVWAILNGEDKIGLCVHKMIAGELDSGDIIARDYLPIDCNTKVTQVWEWMLTRTPPLILDAVNRLFKDKNFVLESQSKNAADILRCYPRKVEDGRIRWQEPASNVLRLINASNKPYAGAFCEFEGKRLIIWDAELIQDEEVFCAVPGQVTKIGKGFIEVACGQGKIRLLNVELDQQPVDLSLLLKSVRERLS